ncbi:MAG: RNA-directed DNA polymerase [Solirubrobacteraceae bacterium]|nr:RNA-directed DNA polymerase [Solirubrobacteraceae bacterium]
MLWQISSESVGALDFVGAIEAESTAPKESLPSLPSRVVEKSVKGREKELAELIGARCTTGIDVSPQELIWMPKPDHVGRHRPVLTLTFEQRVVLRAFATAVAADMPDFDRSPEAFNAFQEAPTRSDAGYVVTADVASFYSYIDHELLASRIVDATAKPDIAEGLVGFLGAIAGRSYGLPQTFQSSDPLSELVIAPIERRLVRAGVEVYRSNDDFRLCVPSHSEGMAALEELQAELWRVGLDLNDDKSWILKRPTYEDNLRRADALVYEYAESTDLSVDVDPYTGEPLGDPAPTSEAGGGFGLDLIMRVFTAASKRRLGATRLPAFESSANRRIVIASLAHLTNLRSPDGLPMAAQLLAVDPLLARQYSFYVRATHPSGTGAAECIDEALTHFAHFTPPWVEAWLINPLLNPSAELTQQSTSWLRKVAQSQRLGVVRARAILALAVHGKTERAEVLRWFDAMPEVARCDMVAAAARASGSDRALDSLRKGNRLFDWVAEWASQTADGDPAWG